MTGATKQKILRMRTQGFKVWAIAAECGLSFNDVAAVLEKQGVAMLLLDHPRERRSPGRTGPCRSMVGPGQ